MRSTKVQTKNQLSEIQNYLTDASNMQGGHAERVFFPESADEISEVLREANEKGIPVTVSGARTGTVGGAIPFGGYVISMERMNRIVEIDKIGMTATVEPGVILADLQKAVEAEGLFYPPDPTEWSCQIGGTVATNASGARSFKYGATRRYVERLKVILANGDEHELYRGRFTADKNGSIVLTTSGGEIKINAPSYGRPNVRKNVSGYFNEDRLDAIDLFIGSEGTLGVITEIELRLLPKPDGFFSGIVFFERESDLLAFVEEARDLSHLANDLAASLAAFVVEPLDVGKLPGGPGGCFKHPRPRIDATLIEYFDDQALNFIREKFPETPAAAGAVFFEQETYPDIEDELVEMWNALLEKHNADIDRSWFAVNAQDREKMREFRHALPVSVNERVVRNKQRKIGTDMAVPDERFELFLKFYKETLNASGLEYVIFGHIGDCHLHANLLPKNDAEAETARHIYGRCIAQAIMLGGCVSAEHGIGKLKRKYLAAMMGERYLNEMAEIKKALDPKGILGRGNMFDEGYLA